MIDTFMVLWNRDRRRKGAKLFLTFLLICISASLLLATLYIPHFISLPKRENFARDFINKTMATATVQADQVDLAHKVSLPGRERAIEVTPTGVVELPCATSAPASILPAPQKKHVKHDAAKKMGKKARQRRGAKSSPHKTSKKTYPLKVIPPPGSTLRSTGSSTEPVLKPTATRDTVVVVVTPVSTPATTPGTAANAAATTISISMGDAGITGATPVATATVESDMARGQRAPESADIPHLQHSGGPIFDDTSTPAPYAAMAANDASQAMQGLSVSCLRNGVFKQALP
jgi:hypothetical protein